MGKGVRVRWYVSSRGYWVSHTKPDRVVDKYLKGRIVDETNYHMPYLRWLCERNADQQ